MTAARFIVIVPRPDLSEQKWIKSVRRKPRKERDRERMQKWKAKRRKKHTKYEE